MPILVPKTEILPEAQKAIWPHLSMIPNHLTLFDGTAVALRYGHRNSIDFDFFSNRAFNFNEFLYNTAFPDKFQLNHFFQISLIIIWF
jgi:hypothetical protein